IVHRLDDAAEARGGATQQHIQNVFERIAKANDTKILSVNKADYQDHPVGGCRMGTDAKESVCDSFGRTHDHPNLFVAGAPTLPTGGCTNVTVTFMGLTLRSAVEVAR